MEKTILAVSIKEIDTKYGLKKQYSIKVRGDQGGEVWMSTFDSAIGAQVETVKSHDIADIEWEKKGNFLNIKSVKKIASAEVQRREDEPPAPEEEGIDPEDDSSGRWYFCPKKNRLISRQSSLERAIQFLALTPESSLTKDAALELAEIFYRWVNK